nr:hypothetical protein [Tanacetum cinerariifolium]
MESLKKIKINRPLLKEIKKTENYAKYMKDLVKKPRTVEDEEIRMNRRCSALLQNHLPLKEQDLGSFVIPYSIGKLDFNNALADLGPSISVMPLSMYKHLGIGKLEPINMVIEMADNTKCTPTRIVENLLIKIEKFIFLVDFVILDMVKDLRMPIILGRPLLSTAHAKVDIFRNDTCPEDDDFKKIDYDLLLYNSESCEFNQLLSTDPDIFSYEIDVHKSYEEIVYRITEVKKRNNLDLKKEGCIGVRRFCKKKKMGEKENLEDPKECGEDKANAIIGAIHNKLNDDWFNNTSEDKDDLDGILDYLEPISYDGFIDLDDEAYNKIRCKLLGMTYMETILILMEKVKVTRYIIGPSEIYTKVKVLGVDKIPRTKDNIAAIRAILMEKMAHEGNGQAKT